MEAREILAILRQRGAVLRALDGNRLSVEPSRALDETLREAIRGAKATLLSELRGGDSKIAESPALATREQLGAVLIRSRRFGEVWLALTEDMAKELDAEESERAGPWPVLLSADIAALRGKPEAAIRGALEVARIFPGARVLQ